MPEQHELKPNPFASPQSDGKSHEPASETRRPLGKAWITLGATYIAWGLLWMPQAEDPFPQLLHPMTLAAAVATIILLCYSLAGKRWELSIALLTSLGLFALAVLNFITEFLELWRFEEF